MTYRNTPPRPKDEDTVSTWAMAAILVMILALAARETVYPRLLALLDSF